MKMNARFKSVIFDLDGTLLDTLDDLANSMNASLASMGFPAHEVESYKIFVGDGVTNLARRTLPAGSRDDETVRECVRRMGDEYARCWRDHTRPYDGIPEMLDALASAGIGMAILSNKPDNFTKEVVSALLPRWSFDCVRGAMDGVPIKPDPDAALEIAREMGVSTDEMLYVGDSGTDMKTAVAAGMYPMGVLWGFRGEEELTSCGARALARTPQEIVAHIKGA